MRQRIFLKLMAAGLLVVVVATVSLDFSVRRVWEASLRREIQRGLTQQTAQFALHLGNAIGNGPAAPAEKRPDLEDLARREAMAASARVTVIDRSGLVLADSEAEPARMENHATRPEFRAALAGKVRSDTRRSHTLGIEFLYVAAPVQGGAVRLAYPLAAVASAIAEVRRTLLLA